MRYQSLTIAVVLLAIVFIAVDSSKFLQRHIATVGDGIKIFVLDSKDSISLSYRKYISQAQAIEEYEQKLKDYERLELELKHAQNELDNLVVFDTQQAFYNDARFLPSRAYSYVNMGDYSRVWLNFDVKDYPEDRIFGVVQDNKALGIAIVQEGRLIGFLNGDKKSSYSVYVGDEKVPAIVHSSALTSDNITADFIPSWKKINIGDQVFTSGLDGIFIEGIAVGEVVSVNYDFGYISAEVKPYAQHSGLGYMWLVDTNIPIQTSAKEAF